MFVIMQEILYCMNAAILDISSSDFKPSINVSFVKYTLFLANFQNEGKIVCGTLSQQASNSLCRKNELYMNVCLYKTITNLCELPQSPSDGNKSLDEFSYFFLEFTSFTVMPRTNYTCRRYQKQSQSKISQELNTFFTW